jgi:enoyl-CoA hydratase
LATIESSVRDGIGRILLNRPAALNALDGPMYAAIGRTLDAWYDDPAVRAVTLRGAGKAFCAGGDIRYTLACVRAGEFDAIDANYREEYRIDHLIHTYPKPIVAVVDGICMGGGMALAMHARYQLVSERALFAMPETEIGFFPDCAMSWVFLRLRGAVGTYLALTGARLSAADALGVGLASHSLASGRIDDVEAVLAACADPAEIDAALTSLGTALPQSELVANRAAIDAAFGGESVAAILAALDAAATPWAAATAATLRRMSPTALVLTFELLQRERTLALADAFALEGRIAGPLSRTPEYAEGVRAVIVDKDRAPKWNPARIEEVDHAAVVRLLDAAEPTPSP